MSYLIKAINNLKPNAEFAFQNNDYSTIEWHKITGTAPTQAQIDAEIEKIKQSEIDTEKAREIAAASAVVKLQALGLTNDEIVAITS